MAGRVYSSAPVTLAIQGVAESPRFVLYFPGFAHIPVNIGGIASRKMPDNAKPANQQDVQQRLQKLLHGAFAGPPTPLAEIPKRGGRARAKRASSTSTKKRRARVSSD
jgi:hypothetical protein